MKTSGVDVARVLYRDENGHWALSTVPRDKASPERGYLDFPGGKIEPGDTPYGTAKKELEEEGWEGDVEEEPFFTIADLPSAMEPGTTHNLHLFRGKDLKPTIEYKERYRGVFPTYGKAEEVLDKREGEIGKIISSKVRDIMRAYAEKKKKTAEQGANLKAIALAEDPEKHNGPIPQPGATLAAEDPEKKEDSLEAFKKRRNKRHIWGSLGGALVGAATIGSGTGIKDRLRGALIGSLGGLGAGYIGDELDLSYGIGR